MTQLSFLLKHNIEAWSAELLQTSPLAEIARRGELSARGLAAYLVSLRFLLEQSQRNLAGAATRARGIGRSDLAQYFDHKVDEERGHERWAIDDLNQLPAAAQSDLEPARNMRVLVALQERLIAQHPLCFLAYTLWTEYVTVLVGDSWLASLETCGFKRSQVSVIANHIEADRVHVARALEEIDQLWTGEPDATAILDGVAQAGRVFQDFCEEIYELAATPA
jgi:hypothetical protein